MKNLKRVFNMSILVLAMILCINISTYAESKDYIYYEIEENDTFNKLAERFRVIVDDIIILNKDVDYTKLAIGEKVKIPTTKIEVGKNENITDVAKKYNMSESKIGFLNNLLYNKVYEGDIINVLYGYKEYEGLEYNMLKVFPFKNREDYDVLTNNYYVDREWSPNGPVDRKHEGIDMNAKYGTPLYAAADGEIVRFGWNTYGGYRINIKLDNNPYHIYYAHLSSYESSMHLGKKVKAGDIIGYVGDSGYGDIGTTGKFDPHLHFGLYDINMKSVSPYEYLKDIEIKQFGK